MGNSYKRVFLSMLISGLAAAACDKPAEGRPPVDAAEVKGPEQAAAAALAQAVAALMNGPVGELHAVLGRAAADGAIYSEELGVSGAQDTTPVDWWLWNKGFIEAGGSDSFGRAWFQLTPRGRAWVDAPTPVWISALPKAPPALDCGASTSITEARCTIQGNFGTALTTSGKSVIAGVELQDVAAKAVAQYSPSTGWTIASVQFPNSDDGAELVRNEVFGTPESVAEPRERWVEAAAQAFARLDSGYATGSAPSPTTVSSSSAATATAGSSVDSSPSFSCAGADHPVERLICSDASLARADRELASAYRSALARSSAPDRVRRDQAIWLRTRNSYPPEADVLMPFYRQRIDMLRDEAADY